MLNSCILASLLTCLAWAGPGLVAGESPLRLGVLANRGELAARTQWSEFAAWLGQQAGRPGELTPLAIGQVPKAVGDATVDLLICNPGLAARVVQESGAVPIATWKAKDGSTRMAGVIIANPKAGIAKQLAQLRSGEVVVDGNKGPGLTFRPWDGQLRQPIMLGHGDGIVGLAPLDGVLHPTEVLDTLGTDQKESKCRPR